MRAIGLPLVLLAFLPADGKPTPKFPVGKETTYVTGPLDMEGFIDYETALNERLSKGITPEKNANVLLWKALGPTPEGGKGMPAEFFKRLGIDEPAKGGTYLIGLHGYMKDHLKLDPSEFDGIEEQRAQAVQRPWKAKDYPHLAGWLKANEKPLTLAIEASKRPEYYNPLVSSQKEKGPGGLLGALLPGVQKCREIAHALAVRAMLRVGEGKVEEAWQDLLACHRLGRLLTRGATLIESLVGIAVEQIASNADLAYLENATLTPKQVQGHLKDLQEPPAQGALADKFDLGERFMYLDCLQLIRRGGFGMLDGLAGGPAPKKPDAEEEKALGMIDWEPALRNGNRWYNRLAAASRSKDRAAREKALDKIEEDIKNTKKELGEPGNLARLLRKAGPDKAVGKMIGEVLTGLMLPAARKVHGAYDRSEQIQRNLRVAFALAAYHHDNGRYPAKLADLAPKYLASVPDDLFSGKALIYRPTEKGYLVYSIGMNGKDEEGHWYDDDPPGDDPRVRMPLPELKRKK